MSSLYVGYNEYKCFLTPVAVEIPYWLKKKLLAQKKNPPPPYRTKALIDTGAKACGASPKLISKLELPSISNLEAKIFTGSGHTYSKRYACSFTCEDEPSINALSFPIFMYKLEDENPFEFIIGMEFMEKFFISYHPANKGIILEYPPPGQK